MVECGGLIFNRHQWEYRHKDFRICKRCGKMQELDYGTVDMPWRIVPTFYEWQARLLGRLEEERILEIKYQNRLQEQKKALKYLQSGEKKDESL